MGRTRSRTIAKKQNNTLKIGLSVVFVFIVVILIFSFLIPIKTDVNSYGNIGYDDGDPNLCIGVNWDNLYQPTDYLYPKKTNFHVLRGELNTYLDAVAHVQSFGAQLPKGQLDCGFAPQYKLFL